jgi:aminoglycoside 3-N-acetyltransferase
LGLGAGDTVIVHTALSRLGWVPGGAAGVVAALVDVVTEAGTLVMPTQTPHLSDPANWENPPVPESWWEAIRNETPAFDPQVTPSRGMGVVPECFRTLPGALRSAHPQVSFAAWGSEAQDILDGHHAGDAFGESSPLAALYARDARVLLLGCGYESCTALHLAEVRATWPGKHRRREGAPVHVEGERRWIWFEDLATDGGDFAAVGATFDADVALGVQGRVGIGLARLLPMRPLVDHAVAWMSRHRG